MKTVNARFVVTVRKTEINQKTVIKTGNVRVVRKPVKSVALGTFMCGKSLEDVLGANRWIADAEVFAKNKVWKKRRTTKSSSNA